jgi:anti-anti-sigma factor
VARVTGEIDLSNANLIENAIAQATPSGAVGLILDVSALDYLDSAGIHLIYRLREKLSARGQGLRIVIPLQSPANDALRLAGVSDNIDTDATIDAALAGFAAQPPAQAIVVVTGANGFVGSRICHELVQRGASVRGIVRRAGTAPELAAVTEVVGDPTDPELAATALSGATGLVTTVHPMGSDRATQHRVGVQGTAELARIAASAGVRRMIHISTAAVYDRSPGVGDVHESSALVADDADDYAVTKRDTDRALAEVEGITRVILRPPAILGPGATSTWNTSRPAEMRDDEQARHAKADQTFPWVHVADLASLAADVAAGLIPDAADPADGPVIGACVTVNVAAPRATQRDYVGAVTEALGVDPVWEQAPVWTGRIAPDRAHGWGWSPAVALDQALAEIVAGLRR